MPKAKPLVGKKTDQVTQHGRDVYVTDEGDNVSELSVTIPIGDKWYNAPSIYDGVRYEEGEVADMIKGGKIKPTSIHDSLEDALDAAQGRTDDIKYAKGGDIMNKQMNLFAEGGMMDDSGEVVNGVEVPPGSLKQEVADDVPAQLSEGEFVVPADVVRFIGLEKLMAMRDKAKAGLQKMQEMGQMGNAQEVDNPDQLFSEADMPEEDLSGFESEIDSILAEDQPSFANGGAVMKFAPGGDVPNLPSDLSVPETPMRSYERAPIRGFNMAKYRNASGEEMFIPTVNGKPLLPVPDGYSIVVARQEDQAEEPAKEEDTTAADNADAAAASSGSNSNTRSFMTEGPDVPVIDARRESSGSGTREGLPGEGVNEQDKLDIAANVLNVTDSKLAKVVSGVLGPVATGVRLGAKAAAISIYDDYLDGMEAAADAVKNNNISDTGVYTYAKQSGGIATVATEDSVRQQDKELFGGYFNSRGEWVGTTETESTSLQRNPYDLNTALSARAELTAEQSAKAAAELAAGVANQGYLTQTEKERIANQTEDPIAAMNALSTYKTGTPPPPPAPAPAPTRNANTVSSPSEINARSATRLLRQGSVDDLGQPYTITNRNGSSGNTWSSTYDRSIGTGGADGAGNYSRPASGDVYAKGGMVEKRQYPSKKKLKGLGVKK